MFKVFKCQSEKSTPVACNLYITIAFTKTLQNFISTLVTDKVTEVKMPDARSEANPLINREEEKNVP